MRYAIINNNLVENVIVADNIETVNSVYPNVQHIEPLDTPDEQKISAPGWEWNPKTKEFIEPVYEVSKVVSSFAFRDKFNREEKIAIRTAETSDVAIKIFVEDYWTSNKMIDLESKDLVDSIDYLVEKGFVKPDRRESLLSL